MPTKRQKTKYTGVTVHIGKNGDEFYYIRFKIEKNGKQIEECCGSKQQGMSAAKASVIRAAKQTKQALTNEEQRLNAKEIKNVWTMQKLFDSYQETLKAGEGRSVDKRNFKKIAFLAEREPHTLETQEIEKIKREMEKTGKAPQTIKHVVSILDRTINYGVKNGLIKQIDSQKLRITKPKIDNKKEIETMSDEQLSKYINALNEEENQISANILRFALVTGMRKTAILSLQWDDIDFINSNIKLRGEVAKKKKTDFIKMNTTARTILIEMQNIKSSMYVFPTDTGTQRQDFRRMARRVRDKAGLSKNFRPLHGLRHTFASRLISSGKVSIAELQKLLTHESPAMTQVYAHFSDTALQKAANAADDVMTINYNS